MRKRFDALDVGFLGDVSTNELVVLATEAEKYGFRTFWTAEDYHGRSCVPSSTYVAAKTKRIRLGWGIVSCFTRHPAIIAMEAATVDEISRGRMCIGIGPVVQSMRKHGIKHAKPIRVLKESVEIIRKMYGRPFTYQGMDFSIPPPGISLEFKPHRKRIPIYVAAMAPQMFKTAGRIGDGIFFSYFASPAFVRYGLEMAAQARKHAGLNVRDMDSVAYIKVYISRNRDLAIKEAEEELSEYLVHLPMAPYRFKFAGFEEGELESLIKGLREAKNKGRDTSKIVTEEIIDRLVVAGSPDECIEKIEKYLDSGLKVPVPFGLRPDRKESVRLLGKFVMPHLVES